MKNGVSYQVKLRDQTGNWYPTGSFKTEIEAKAEELKLQKLKQRGVGTLSSEAKVTTVNEYWSVWSVENRSDVSAGWKISQDQMYRDYIAPVIGEKMMSKIGVPEIGKILNVMKDKGKGEQTRKHVYGLLRKMFADAIDYYDMLAMSPVKSRFHRPKVKRKKRNFLHPSEAFHFLEFTKDHYLGPAIWLGLLSALRISEIQALQGKHLLYESNQILICRAYNNKTKNFQDFPKQENATYVPLPPMLKAYLQARTIPSWDFVAPGSKGGMLSYNTFVKALRTLCRKAGVTAITPHELRHTSTEIYFHAGASTEDIRRLLNHASFAATSHYIHRTDERLNAIAEGITQSSAMFPKMFPNGNKGAIVSLTERKRNV